MTATFPRTFIAQRDEDVTGISGEGVVAEGVLFSDGWAVTHWLDQPPMNEPKTEVWHNPGTLPFEKISGHRGLTRLLWADEVAAARQKAQVDIIKAFDVPPSFSGRDAETAYYRAELEQRLGGASSEWRRDYAVIEGLGSVPGQAEVRGYVPQFADAVMPLLHELMNQRDAWLNAVGRAFALAHRWEAAHGSAYFLVRAAGAELRDELTDEQPSGIRGLLEHVGIDTRGRDITVAGRVVDAAGPAGHLYLSTGCFHGQHGYCQSNTGQNGGKLPAQCKFCQAPCLCRCHQGDKEAGIAEPTVQRTHSPAAHEGNVTTPAMTCSARCTGVSPARDCIRAAGHTASTDHTDSCGNSWVDSLAEYPVDRDGAATGMADVGPEFDATSALMGRIEVRDPCPWCPDRPMVPRIQMDEHVTRAHPEVQTVVLAGPVPGQPTADELAAARATNRRLNLRAQRLESELGAYRRAVGQWTVTERGTYIPLRTLSAIAKAAGRYIETPQWLMHYQRVEQAEAAIERVRDYLAVLESAGWSQAAIARRIRVALDGAEQPTAEA